jgi:hypothetical protein
MLLMSWKKTTKNALLKLVRTGAGAADYIFHDSKKAASLRTRLRHSNGPMKASKRCPKSDQHDVRCRCGAERETVRHYLLHCPLHTHHRSQVLRAMRKRGYKGTIANWLGSRDSLSEDNFKHFLQLTAVYFAQTRRFKILKQESKTAKK